MKRKVIALTLILLLIAGILPYMAFATGETDNNGGKTPSATYEYYGVVDGADESQEETTGYPDYDGDVVDGEYVPEEEDYIPESNSTDYENSDGGGYIGIMPAIGEFNIIYYVRNVLTPALPIYRDVSGLAERPGRMNRACAVTDANFNPDAWPGWEVVHWTVNYGFITLDWPPVYVSASTHSTIRTNWPPEIGPYGAGDVTFNADDYTWSPQPVFQIFIEPVSPTISKESSMDLASIFLGEVIEYTITVSNPAILPMRAAIYGGGPHITNIFDDFRILDSLPPMLSLVPGSVVVTGARGTPVNNSIGNAVDIIIDLPHADDNGDGTAEPGIVTITFEAVVTSAATFGGTIENTASLTGRGGTVSESAVNLVPVATKPTLTKIVHQIGNTPYNGQAVFENNAVTYRLTITNPNDRIIDNFLVRDTLPLGLGNITDVTVTPASVWDGIYTIGGGGIVGYVLELDINLPSSPAAVIIDFTVTIEDEDLADAGNFINTAYLFGPYAPSMPQDPNPLERPQLDDDTANVRLATPEIQLVKSVSPAPWVYAGDNLTYTLVVTNTGNVPLFNVTVTDDLDPTLNPVFPHLDLTGPAVQVTIEFSDGRPGKTAPLADLMDDGINIGTLYMYEDYATLTFTVTVREDARGGTILDNEAEAEGFTGEGTGADSGVRVYDDCYATTTVISEPDITILKSVGSPVAIAGGNILYTLVVTNSGNVDLAGVIVTDNLNPALNPAYPHVVANPATVVNVVFSDARSNTTTTLSTLMSPGFAIGDLEVGEYVTLTFTVAVVANAPNSAVLNNTATTSGEYTHWDGELEIVSDEDNAIVSLASIQLVKSVSPALVYAGNDLTYTLVVTNTGSVPLYNVSVTDDLDPVSPASSPVLPHLDLAGTEQVTVVFSDGRPGITAPLTNLMEDGINIGTLGVGEFATLTFVVTVDEDTMGGTMLDNEADVVGNTSDGTGGNNGLQVTDDCYAVSTVISEPDITIVKSVGSPTVAAGGNITYTLVVTNSGNVDLTNVIVTDDLDPALNPVLSRLALTGTEVVAVEFSDASADITIPLADLMAGFTIGDLEVGEYVTLAFTVAVAAGVPHNTIMNNTATTGGIYIPAGGGLPIEEVDDADNATVTVPASPPPPPTQPPTSPGGGSGGSGGGGSGFWGGSPWWGGSGNTSGTTTSSPSPDGPTHIPDVGQQDPGGNVVAPGFPDTGYTITHNPDGSTTITNTPAPGTYFDHTTVFTPPYGYEVVSSVVDSAGNLVTTIRPVTPFDPARLFTDAESDRANQAEPSGPAGQGETSDPTEATGPGHRNPQTGDEWSVTGLVVTGTGLLMSLLAVCFIVKYKSKNMRKSASFKG